MKNIRKCFLYIFCLFFLTSCSKKSIDINPPQFTTPKIIFSSNRDRGKYEIYVMDADGKNQQKIISGNINRYPSIKPSGDGIIFSSNRTFSGYLGIFSSWIDGTNIKEITSPVSWNDTYPVYSKKGDKIAFTSNQNGKNEIFLIDGYGKRKFAEGKMADFYLTDEAIIYVVENEQGNSNICHQRIGSDIKTNLSKTIVGRNEYPRYSSDGVYILYSSNKDGNWEIYRMKPDGTEQTRLTNDTARDISPSYCTEIGKVIFSSDRDGDMEIYAMDIDGGNIIQLTHNTYEDVDPVVFCPK